MERFNTLNKEEQVPLMDIINISLYVQSQDPSVKTNHLIEAFLFGQELLLIWQSEGAWG